MTYDDSPEFRHEPRDIFPTTFVPGRGRGPYGTRQNKENGLEENFEETADYGEYRVNESAEGDEDEENFAGGGESYSDDGDEENHRPGNGFYNSNFEEDFGDDRGSLFDSSERFNSGQSFFNDFTSGSVEEFDGFHSNYFSRLNSRYETSPGQDSHEDGEF